MYAGAEAKPAELEAAFAQDYRFVGIEKGRFGFGRSQGW
jgi:hypothetical protein